MIAAHMPLDVWLIQTGEPLPGRGIPMRTGLLAEALTRRGHRVLWWTSGFDHFTKRWLFERDGPFPMPGGISGYAVRGCGYRTNTSARRFLDHRIVAWKWKRAARCVPSPHVAVVSTPPHDLATVATAVARGLGVPTVLDLRDPWPDLLLDVVPPGLRRLARAALSLDFRRLSRAILHADSVVAVSRAMLDWGRRLGARSERASDRVFYTGGRRVPHEERTEKVARLIEALRGQFVVAFVGTFGFYHSPFVAVEAARRLRREEIHFVLAGEGDAANALRESARSLPNVHFPGWLTEAEAADVLASAHVGICPTGRPTLLLPNKAVAYLRAGLPVISAFDGDLRDLIETRGIGFQVVPNDVPAFVQCVATLHRNHVLRTAMAGKARALYQELFDAERIVEDYVDHVEMIAAGGPVG